MVNRGALSQKAPGKDAKIHRRCKRQWENGLPQCEQSASYLWSLLWPTDHRDTSDGQIGVVICVFLQDVLWPKDSY